MDPKRSPFPVGWWSIELEGYRDHPETFTTYSLFPYESLPPLPREIFRGTFQWLDEQPSEFQPSQETREFCQIRVRSVADDVSKLGLALPEAFERFMGSAEMQAKVRSCTDCGFDLSYPMIKSSVGSGYLICFLTDSQGCLFWWLYLTKAGGHCIVVTGGSPDDWESDELDDEENDPPIVACAPSFEEFIYRFWLENEIWYALDEKTPLTAGQQAYLDHYSKRQDT